MSKVTLLIPTLNEISGMKHIMPQIKREWYDQLIVVDGGSVDGTIEYARQAGYFVLSQKKRGIRYAYIEAMEHVEGDIVITFSPDGNSVPDYIPQLIKKIEEGFDMVIVSRYLEDAKSYDDDFITALGNKTFTFIINLFFRSRYTDSMVMFRAWKKNVFFDLDLDKEKSYSLEEKIFHTRIGIEPLLSIRAAKRKLKCADIPGDEPKRIGGERKLRIVQWGCAYLMEVFRELFFWH